MSGESTGLLVVPLAMAVAPIVLGGLVVAGVTKATASVIKSVHDHEERKRIERKAIQESGILNEMSEIRFEMIDFMNRETNLNIELSELMLQEIQKQQMQLNDAAQLDPELFQGFIASMSRKGSQTTDTIIKAQEEFSVRYRNAVTESMNGIARRINDSYSESMSIINQLKLDIRERNAKARETAEEYINKAKALLQSLREEFEADRFLPREFMMLIHQMEDVQSIFDSEQYEAAIGGAKDLSLNCIECIFEADHKRQERNNALSVAMTLSEQLKIMTEEMEYVTPEVKAKVDNSLGQFSEKLMIDDEMIGARIGDYSEKNEDGQPLFDFYKGESKKLYDMLRSPEADSIPVTELQQIIEKINKELYPEFIKCTEYALSNMCNSFSRYSAGEKIIDYFEENDFVFAGSCYDEMDDSPLHMAFSNSITNEIVTVTLSPEYIGNQIQTRIKMDEINGDELDEDRKAYLRSGIESVLADQNPYSKISISCNAKTRGQLSRDLSAFEKIRKSQGGH